MLKDHPKWLYEYNGKKLRLSDLYRNPTKNGSRQNKERSCNAPMAKAHVLFLLPAIKNVAGWLCCQRILSLAEPEIIRLYGNVGISRFFQMCKQHLKLVKEIQLRDFDGLIGHTSMVLARYNVLTWSPAATRGPKIFW
ncbi:MAG: hypothetical protein R2861_12240 [Desulfobacterales bacterium]